MLFGNSKKSTQVQKQIDGVDIEMVNENTFIGVIIDDKLSWKSHINHVHNKLSRSISSQVKLSFIVIPLHVDIQWNEMSCLTVPRCYINTDIQQ